SPPALTWKAGASVMTSGPSPVAPDSGASRTRRRTSGPVSRSTSSFGTGATPMPDRSRPSLALTATPGPSTQAPPSSSSGASAGFSPSTASSAVAPSVPQPALTWMLPAPGGNANVQRTRPLTLVSVGGSPGMSVSRSTTAAATSPRLVASTLSNQEP